MQNQKFRFFLNLAINKVWLILTKVPKGMGSTGQKINRKPGFYYVKSIFTFLAKGSLANLFETWMLMMIYLFSYANNKGTKIHKTGHSDLAESNRI